MFWGNEGDSGKEELYCIEESYQRVNCSRPLLRILVPEKVVFIDYNRGFRTKELKLKENVSGFYCALGLGASDQESQLFI
jgi:hypothetical protein